MVDEDQTFRFCHNSQFQGKGGEWRHSFYEHGFYIARCSRTISFENFKFLMENFVLIDYVIMPKLPFKLKYTLLFLIFN